MEISLPPLLWDSRDVAAWLCQPVRRVEKMARDGAIPSIVIPGGGRVFDPAELARWLDDLRKGGPDAA